MSDMTGSATPGADAGPSPMPAMETLHEAATNRLDALRADSAFGARVLAQDAAAVNERRSLMEIIHGAGDEASKAALAASIKLEARPTLAAAERQREAVQAAADARAPQYSYQDRGDFGSAGLGNVTKELNEWTVSIGLPASTAKTVTQAVVNSGIRTMDAQTFSAWKERQDSMLLGAAHGDHDLVKSWRDAAAKVLAAGKYNFDNSAALNSAFVIRVLANVGATRK